MAARRLLLALAAAALVFGFAVAGGLAWLVATESGLGAAARLAAWASGERLTLEPAGGTLAGPLHLSAAAWEEDGSSIRAEDIVLDWTPAALLSRRLEIADLTVAALHIDQPPDGPPPQAPDSLRLPLAVEVGRFSIARLERGGAPLAEGIAGRFSSDGVRHRLNEAKARLFLVDVAAEAELNGDPPFDMKARGELAGSVREKPFALALEAAGPLAGFTVAGRGSGAVSGDLQAELTPFAAKPFARARVNLSGIDLAAWVAGAPATQLDLDADLAPRPGEGLAVAGPFAVTNRIPGRIDAGRLPVEKVSGRLAWHADTADLSELSARLAGGGKLGGSGRYAAGKLALDLAASRVDAAALHSRLQPTRLDGPLAVEAGAEVQSLKAELADQRFKLTLDATRRGDRVDVPALRLDAGDASLQASGRLGLAAPRHFEASGELVRFDPSRFVKMPPARLNARFKAAGSLAPKPAFRVEFDLLDSRFNGQPLAGGGTLDLDWPRVRQAEVKLVGGPNRIEAHGAFGRAGDVLSLLVDAPELGPYGLEGGAAGQFRIGGTPAVPTLQGELQAARLGLPGVARVDGLRLKADVGSRADDPLLVDLQLARLDTAARPGAARDVALRIEGSRARHVLQGGALLAGARRLALEAAGGLNEKSGTLLWSGELRRLALQPPEPELAFQLAAPAPLKVGATEWSLGPAELTGSEWRARLQAAAAGGRLSAAASGSGQRIGDFEGRLEARLEGAWKIAAAAPWQGGLSLKAAELAWLGPLLGEGWRTAGRLRGELRLAGTPADPLLSGQVEGEGLQLQVASQGLRLENGRLAAELSGHRLRLATLAFDSRLRPLPRPLALAGGADLAALTATPGRLEMGGELAFGQEGQLGGPDSGQIDIRLDRVGVFQLPDQWIAASGDGRLRWQGGVLGVGGRLEVDAGWWELARLGVPRLSDDVVVRQTGEAPAAPATRPDVELDVAVDLGRHFHFQGNGLESRLAGNVRLTATGNDLPRASGSIRTVGGRFDAYGQKLAIERGILNFQGFPDNPSLNVRAVRKGLPVEPGVEVTGTAKRPVVRLVSDPELPEAEKLSWLVLGRGAEQLGAGDASALLAAAGGILGKDSGGVVQQLQRRFGIDELALRQGNLGDAGGRQATSRVAAGSGFDATTPTTGGQIVTVGKRLSSNVLLSYEQALGRTGNIVKLTVNLSRRLSLVGRTGSDNALDLFYTFSFGRR